MPEAIRVCIDAMGGDNAPAAPVQGAVDAVKLRNDIKVVLVGQEDVIQAELSKYEYPSEQIEIVNATEIIEMAEHPVNAIRTKKDSSMVVGMKMVRDRQADAFISAGSSFLVASFILARTPSIQSPTVCFVISIE